jgi:hypothetical protein
VHDKSIAPVVQMVLISRERHRETERGVKSSPTNNNNDALATNRNNKPLNAVTAESNHS